MSELKYVAHQPISLKSHPEFNETWLQDRIAEDPTIIGLGDVVLIDRERSQERAGQLDLLLTNPEQDGRYELEVMLGATDESHIIRCIEYWDIERRRYPGYEHCAVLIAEDITSRFFKRHWIASGNGAAGCHPTQRTSRWRPHHPQLRSCAGSATAQT